MDRKGDGVESGSTSLALLPLDSFSKDVPLSLCPALTLVCLREATVWREHYDNVGGLVTA